MTRPTLLCLNAGSASLKFALYALADCDGPALPARAALRGEIAAEGERTMLRWRDAQQAEHACASPAPRGDVAAEVDVLFDRLLAPPMREGIAAVAHRIVHGGQTFTTAQRIDPAVRAALEALRSLAPLHQGPGLAGVDAAAAHLPAVPQIACFDTAFHASLDPLARRYPIPRDWHDRGAMRYGFHGLSYDAIARQLPPLLGDAARGRVVVAHLGGGASLCGLVDGHSRSTTMGFTALDGLMMSTRCGSIDPGMVLHWITEEGRDPRAVTATLYHASGLLGVSGTSGDLRELLASADPHAAEAVALFVRSMVHHIAATAADIGGLDALVFTGGIGAGSAEIRAQVVQALAWLGLALDPAANEAGGPRISAATSRVPVLALATDEEGVMALQAAALLAAATSSAPH